MPASTQSVTDHLQTLALKAVGWNCPLWKDNNTQLNLFERGICICTGAYWARMDSIMHCEEKVNLNVHELTSAIMLPPIQTKFTCNSCFDNPER